MDKTLSKLSYKYEFLKLELEEHTELFDSYLPKWNKILGKYIVDKNSVMWVNEETGEIKDKPPKEKIKSEPDPRLKKLYRKLSRFAHPDKGGSSEEFDQLKSAYEDGDLFEMIKFATKYDVGVDVTLEDTASISKRIEQLNFKIEEIQNSLCWAFFRGDRNKKRGVLIQLQQIHGIELSDKEIENFLDL